LRLFEVSPIFQTQVFQWLCDTIIPLGTGDTTMFRASYSPAFISYVAIFGNGPKKIAPSHPLVGLYLRVLWYRDCPPFDFCRADITGWLSPLSPPKEDENLRTFRWSPSEKSSIIDHRGFLAQSIVSSLNVCRYV
jgi:hypothetical protein